MYTNNETYNELREKIENLWDGKHSDLSCVHLAMALLDTGKARVAQKTDNGWLVNEYLKKAILLFFKHSQSKIMEGGLCCYFDKVPLKTHNWTDAEFMAAGFRSVPGSFIRYGAYIAKSAVVMPSFINVGAFVDEGTMVDTNALVGSCAQIGKNCHISDGVCVGGVLEPLQATPVIIENNCFIGVRSSVTEGVIVEEGAVLASGVNLTSSTKILDRETGKISYGKIPSYAVVVPGTYPSGGNVNLCCAVVVKQVDRQTREKTAINELLRIL